MAPYNPPITHYTELDVSSYSVDLLLCLVGKGGNGFYKLTDRLRLEYIWYDIDRKVVELWGSYSSLRHGAKDKLNKILKTIARKRDKSNAHIK